MSFHRVGGPAKKKKALSRKKPIWDDSVHDLTVYRATPQEVLMRKEAHKSKNHVAVKLEKMRAEQQRAKLSGADLQKLAIMKEVLYDQHQLQQVLAKSDSMMAVVKDLFGDDPKRSMGFPNITSAPQSESASSNLVDPVPDIYTRSEKLSDSVMNQSAINDFDDSDSDSDEDGIDRPEPISYKSKLNLQHFQDYLKEEEKRVDHLNPPTLVASQNVNSSNSSDVKSEHAKLSQLMALLELKNLTPDFLVQNPPPASLLADSQSKSDFQTPPRNQQQPLERGSSPPSAINDTQKVKKTRKEVVMTQPAQENANVSMSDMRQALKMLEDDLAAYEFQTGRVPKGEGNKTESFSGYTVALVSAVSRLTKYLKETDLRVRTEATLREQLTQDVYQLRAIIDALASDLIMTQEEYAKLYSENQRYKETTSAELASMNKQIVELQTILGAHLPNNSPRGLTDHGPQRLQEDETQDTVNTNQKTQDSRISTPNQGNSGKAVAEVSSAVLLSPVIRKTRVHSNVNPAGQSTKRQTSLLDVSDLAVSYSSQSSDPPQLTQAPPVMKSISVPRPISLVQSNVPVPLTSVAPTATTMEPVAHLNNYNETGSAEISKPGGNSLEQMQQLQDLAVEEALQNPALQDLMQNQIAELNRQQEEARKRLKDLLANQKLQQLHLQQHLGSNISVDDRDNFLPSEQQMNHLAVSPPISPIPSPPSDRPPLRDVENLTQHVPRTKGISLTLPMADLDVSGGSLSSPPWAQEARSDQ